MNKKNAINAPIDVFSADRAVPEKLLHLGRAYGLLSYVRREEDCQIARINRRQIVLPADLDLSAWVGKCVGMMRYNDRVLIRPIEQPPLMQYRHALSEALGGLKDDEAERWMVRCLIMKIDVKEGLV